MVQLVIPDLQRKFQILIERGILKDKNAMAAHLVRNRKTLDSWAHGSDTREPGLVPEDRREAVIDLFAKCFPATADQADVIAALQQPAHEFEAWIKRVWSIGFDDLLAKHAVSDVGRLLIREENGRISLVEIEAETDSSRPTIKRGQWFRIEFDNPIKGDTTVAFQITAGMTASLTASINETSTKLLIPSSMPDGTIPHMRERTHFGPHDFVALHLAAPLPRTLHQALITKKLIQPDALDQLTAHLIDLSPSTWRLFILQITVDDTDGEMRDD